MKAIDCLVNVHFGETEKQPTWMLKVRDDYFKGPESMFAPVELTELLDEMDAHGVRKAIPDGQPRQAVGDGAQIRRGQARAVRPGHGRGEPAAADALPAGTYCRRQRPARGVCGCGAELLGDGQYPPSDAVYYPLYTKCAELELPLCINTGIPGPPIPGEVQIRSTSTGCACGSRN